MLTENRFKGLCVIWHLKLLILLNLNSLALNLLLRILVRDITLKIMCNQFFVIAEGPPLILNIWLTIL